MDINIRNYDYYNEGTLAKNRSAHDNFIFESSGLYRIDSICICARYTSPNEFGYYGLGAADRNCRSYTWRSYTYLE